LIIYDIIILENSENILSFLKGDLTIMQKMKNNVHLEGWVYESKLELKVTGA